MLSIRLPNNNAGKCVNLIKIVRLSSAIYRSENNKRLRGGPKTHWREHKGGAKRETLFADGIISGERLRLCKFSLLRLLAPVRDTGFSYSLLSISLTQCERRMAFRFAAIKIRPDPRMLAFCSAGRPRVALVKSLTKWNGISLEM